MPDAALSVDRGDGAAPGSEHRLGAHRQRHRRAGFVIEPADAVAPFGGAAGGIACQIIDTDAGMVVQDAERRLLGFELFDHEGEHDVLQHVGMASGMEGVAVVHALSVRGRRQTLNRW